MSQLTEQEASRNDGERTPLRQRFHAGSTRRSAAGTVEAVREILRLLFLSRRAQSPRGEPM